MSPEGVVRLGGESTSPSRPTMTVVGCGGAGCNTLGRAADRGLYLGSHLACNTDAQHLLSTRAHRKVLLGRLTTYGRGANADLALGERACEEASNLLADALEESDICVILTGLNSARNSSRNQSLLSLSSLCTALVTSLSDDRKFLHFFTNF